jgi:hypothetical protein
MRAGTHGWAGTGHDRGPSATTRRRPPRAHQRRSPAMVQLTTALIVAGDAGIGIVFGAAVAAIALAIAILGCPRGE